MRERFERVDFSISSVFSMTLNIPAPPPPPLPLPVHIIQNPNAGRGLFNGYLLPKNVYRVYMKFARN